MPVFLRHKLILPAALSALSLTFFAACLIFDLRLNTTASMPKGIYYVSAAAPAPGSQVELCLEGEFAGLALERAYLRSGRCDSGIMPLVKTLAGLPGDEIAIWSDGIRVNGGLFPESVIRSFDSKGRRMPVKLQSGVIPEGQALVLSAHAGGFDGRYFGLVELHRLRKVEPLILF